MYTITIPGAAKGKQRPRATRTGRVYTPDQTVNAEAWVKTCAVQQVGQPCLEGALSLVMDITVAIPASWPKKRKAAAMSGEMRPTGKPDIDNCLKLFADALNGICWRDDAQIADVRAIKRYGAEPQTVLSFAPLGDAA